MSVAARIKQVIDDFEQGNISAAARRLDCSSSGLQKICAGETESPRSDLLHRIVREYGVDPRWLLMGDTEKVATGDGQARREAVKLLREMLNVLEHGPTNENP